MIWISLYGGVLIGLKRIIITGLLKALSQMMAAERQMLGAVVGGYGYCNCCGGGNRWRRRVG